MLFRHRRLTGRPPEGRLGGGGRSSVSEELAGRVLPFNDVSAVHYASLVMARRKAGTPVEAFDALIAAATLAAGASLAMRDTGGFAGCELSVINPWEAT